MRSDHPKRLSRLTAIQNALQTGRIITATELSEKFAVSIRTIYRDIRALEDAGVPVLTEEGKGYSLMEGYRIPPVMFTEKEANALILAEQLVLKNKDVSFIRDYTDAISKIQAVLRHPVQNKANLLADRTRFAYNTDRERNSHCLSDIQFAITNYQLVKLNYTNEADQSSDRVIEPFALLSTQEGNWLLIAWCRLREAFRFFRLDRIREITVLREKFTPHRMTLQEFLEKYY